MQEEFGFWLAVMIAAVIGVILFKLIASQAGKWFPGLSELGAFA